MLDFLQNLRMQTLFNPQFWNTMSNNGNPDSMPGSSVSIPRMPQPIDMSLQGDPNPTPLPNNPMSQQMDMGGNGMGGNIEDWLNKLYSPEHVQSDRLNSLLNSYPNRQDYEPHGVKGFFTKLGAIAGGMTGGPQLYSEVMDHNFNDKLKDWNNQIVPAEHAATLEKQANTNERTAAMQTIADKLRQEANDIREKNNQKTADLKQQQIDEKAKNDEANAKIRQQRADVYEFKAKNPGLKLVMTKGGNVQAMDPITGELHDTGVPTGSLTDADRLALTQENKIEQIHTTGEETRTTNEQKNEQTLGQIDERGNQSRLTKQTPSGNQTGSNKPELPSQTRVRQVNKARELFNSRPDLRPFIKIQGNDVQITPPGKNFFGSASGPTPAQYKEINDSIYAGTLVSPISSHDNNSPSKSNNITPNQPISNTPQVTAPLSKQVQNKTTGEVRTAYSYDGGKTWTFAKR